MTTVQAPPVPGGRVEPGRIVVEATGLTAGYAGTPAVHGVELRVRSRSEEHTSELQSH